MIERGDTRKCTQETENSQTRQGQEEPRLLASGREMPVCRASLRVCMWVRACLQVHVSIHGCGDQRPILSIIFQVPPTFSRVCVCHWPGASMLDRMAPGIRIAPPPQCKDHNCEPMWLPGTELHFYSQAHTLPNKLSPQLPPCF